MAKETALEILRRKLDELQQQEAITADASIKFQLKEQIRESEEQIAKLTDALRQGAELHEVAPLGFKSSDVGAGTDRRTSDSSSLVVSKPMHAIAIACAILVGFGIGLSIYSGKTEKCSGRIFWLAGYPDPIPFDSDTEIVLPNGDQLSYYLIPGLKSQCVHLKGVYVDFPPDSEKLNVIFRMHGYRDLRITLDKEGDLDLTNLRLEEE